MYTHTDILVNWLSNRKELHLLNLGQLGSIKETVDGGYTMKIDVDEKGKVRVTHRGFYDGMSVPMCFSVLENFLKTDMYKYIRKIFRTHGAFTILGSILYLEQDWYDEDNTVTFLGTKYHKVMFGLNGMIILDEISFRRFSDEVIEDEILQNLKLSFNINKYKGFSCITSEELIPTENEDVSIKVDKNFTIEKIRALAINTKSKLNGQIDIKGCHVRGYTIITKQNEFILIDNPHWEDIANLNSHKWKQIVEHYFQLLDKDNVIGLSKSDVELFVKKCNDFLFDKNIPKGVRKMRLEKAESFLMKLCNRANETKDFKYLKYYSDMITPPTD